MIWTCNNCMWNRQVGFEIHSVNKQEFKKRTVKMSDGKVLYNDFMKKSIQSQQPNVNYRKSTLTKSFIGTMLELYM